MFAIRPTFATIVKLQREITESKKTLQALDTKVKALDSATKLLEKVNPVMSKLEISIPGEAINYGDLTRSFEILAQQTGVVMDNFALGEGVLMSRLNTPYIASKNQVTTELPISLKVTGTYPSCLDFLTRAITNLRLTDIDSLTLAHDGGAKRGAATTGLTMTISGKVFYMADSSALNKVFPEKKGDK